MPPYNIQGLQGLQPRGIIGGVVSGIIGGLVDGFKHDKGIKSKPGPPSGLPPPTPHRTTPTTQEQPKSTNLTGPNPANPPPEQKPTSTATPTPRPTSTPSTPPFSSRSTNDNQSTQPTSSSTSGTSSRMPSQDNDPVATSKSADNITLTSSSLAPAVSSGAQEQASGTPVTPQEGLGKLNHRQSIAIAIGIGIGIFFALLLLTLAIFLILRRIKRKRRKLFRKEFYDTQNSFDKESRFSGSDLTSDVHFPTTIEDSGSQGRSRYRDSQTTTSSLPRRVWDALSIANLSAASYSQDMHGHSHPGRSQRRSYSTMRS